MSDNLYAPPSAPIAAPKQTGLLQQLKWNSTWLLITLGLITHGIYYAHYADRQSRIINRHCPSNPIPLHSLGFLYSISYVSTALFVVSLFFSEGSLVALLSSLSNLIFSIMFIIWGFRAQTRVNQLLGLGADNPQRIKGLWTFLFTPLHFNYKINVLAQAPERPTSTQPSTPMGLDAKLDEQATRIAD